MSHQLIMKLQVLASEGLDSLWFLDDYQQILEACFFEYDCRWRRRGLWLL